MLERGVTHISDDHAAPPLLIASRIEQAYPEADLPSTYMLSRKFGLSPDQKSFLFKMVQSLLPTKERLARLGKVQSSICTFCEQEVDTTAHLLSCSQSSEVATPLLRCLTDYADNITNQNVVLLNINTSEPLELPVVWLIATCLKMIWEERAAGRTARLVNCQAELQARLLVLKHTRWKHYALHNSALLLEEMLNLHF